MATPDFILKLRAKIGHEALWIPGARAVVFDDAGRVLLGQRADNGQWGLITGILEPGEEPAAGMLREVLEETGVVAAAERLVSVDAVGPTTYPNGDVCHFLTLVFRCRYRLRGGAGQRRRIPRRGLVPPGGVPGADARAPGEH